MKDLNMKTSPLLVPYAGWVAFATALNAAIARRNPKGLA